MTCTALQTAFCVLQMNVWTEQSCCIGCCTEDDAVIPGLSGPGVQLNMVAWSWKSFFYFTAKECSGYIFSCFNTLQLTNWKTWNSSLMSASTSLAQWAKYLKREQQRARLLLPNAFCSWGSFLDSPTQTETFNCFPEIGDPLISMHHKLSAKISFDGFQEFKRCLEFGLTWSAL